MVFLIIAYLLLVSMIMMNGNKEKDFTKCWIMTHQKRDESMEEREEDLYKRYN